MFNSLNDILSIVAKLCRKLQYTTGKVLTIEYFNDHYQDCINQLDKVLKNGDVHLKNVPRFLNETCRELDIDCRRELRGRLDGLNLEDIIYDHFVENIKNYIIEP